jgi:four helix bundle protein
LYESFEKLIVLKKSHSFVLKIYEITKNFPKEELYGLTSQIRRAAVSIPSNIVEGKSRNSKKDYLRFLLISRGSLEEVKYQLLLSKDLNYIKDKDYIKLYDLTNEVGKLINGLINSIKNQIYKNN